MGVFCRLAGYDCLVKDNIVVFGSSCVDELPSVVYERTMVKKAVLVVKKILDDIVNLHVNWVNFSFKEGFTVRTTDVRDNVTVRVTGYSLIRPT